MVKNTLLWDFDGVIADSRELKEASFRFAVAPDGESYEKAMGQLHMSSGGVPRLIKFRKYLQEVNQNSRFDERHLVERFERHLLSRWLDVPQVPGVSDLIRDMSNQVDSMFVVTAAKRSEVESYLSEHKLIQYMDGVFGNEKSKEDHIRFLSSASRADHYCLVGDSEADWSAAKATDIHFIYFSQCSEWRCEFERDLAYVASDAKALEQCLMRWTGMVNSK